MKRFLRVNSQATRLSSSLFQDTLYSVDFLSTLPAFSPPPLIYCSQHDSCSEYLFLALIRVLSIPLNDSFHGGEEIGIDIFNPFLLGFVVEDDLFNEFFYLRSIHIASFLEAQHAGSRKSEG